jgi:hypothetical protein
MRSSIASGPACVIRLAGKHAAESVTSQQNRLTGLSRGTNSILTTGSGDPTDSS